jgi:hypothetical protein
MARISAEISSSCGDTEGAQALLDLARLIARMRLTSDQLENGGSGV